MYQRFYKRHSLEQHPFLLPRNSSHAQGRACCWLIVAEVTSWFGWAWFVLQSKLENDLFLWLAQAYLENNVGVWKVLSWYENFDSFCFLFTWELLRVLGASYLLNWIVGQEIILTFSVLWGHVIVWDSPSGPLVLCSYSHTTDMMWPLWTLQKCSGSKKQG